MSRLFRVIDNNDRERNILVMGLSEKEVKQKIKEAIAHHMKRGWKYIEEFMGEEISLMNNQEWICFLHFVKEVREM